MASDYEDLGPDDLQQGEVQLRKTAGGQRLVCLEHGGVLHVLDDRCPHQGYPLSQGNLRDGELTCAWHNWKFDVGSGACTTGGDAVQRFPARVREGRIEVDVSIDETAEAERARAGITTGLFEGDPSRAVRDALRLAGLPRQSMKRAFATLVHDTARRNRWGFGHELAAVCDLLEWVDAGDLEPVEAFTVAATWVAERMPREAPRPTLEPRAAPSTVDDRLEAEDHAGAEAAVRHLVRVEGGEAAVQAMLPFVSRAVLDYGHGAIYLAKAHELATRLPEIAEEVLAAAAWNLSWATKETSLPPWAATRRALDALDALDTIDALDKSDSAEPGGRALVDAEAYAAAVLEGEACAARATVTHLEAGVRPQALLRVTARAASLRLTRFDPSLATRVDLDASVLDVSHLVTFAEAALALEPLAAPRDGARLAVLAASFVGKLSAADRDVEPHSDEASLDGVLEAFDARDPERACSAAWGLCAADRGRAFRALRPFAALDAFVRPIFAIHAVKGLEALRRLHEADPDPVHLAAYARLAAPRWPERGPRRSAAIAVRFMKDGRPPKGLY